MGTRVFAFFILNDYKDHPHAYGDKVDALMDNADTLGSSPRVWGQVLILQAVAISPRIIPTRMGTSRRRGCLCAEWWDHPHAYGDKILNGTV